MPLEPLESPPIFPDFVSCCAARLPTGDHRLHFAAGRECADRAMAALGVPITVIERGPAGEPLWPAGVTGSITHKGTYVSAAVARTSDVRSLGIDVEEIVGAERAERIARVVMLPEESEVAAGRLPLSIRVTLLFSIKEAIFKCLYPLVGRRFYYDAMIVDAMDSNAGTFLARCAASLPPFAAGATLHGRMFIDDRRVFTAAFVHES
jgi:enterobactin synthetase component D